MNVATKSKIVPFLWFDKDAEAAMQFYTSVFNNAKIIQIQRHPEGVTEGPTQGMGGKVLCGVFEIEGQRFMALDGGPMFQFSSAISIYVECDDQAEVDYLWDKLSADPQAESCGWLKDQFGLTWQIVPKQLGDLLFAARWRVSES